MVPEIKAKWLTALRSGNYKQGTNYLNQINPDGGNVYCCLGVLCELAHDEGVVSRESSPDGEVFIYGREKNLGQLPEAVMAWSGVSTAGGAIPDIENTLISLNDTGSSFAYIADIIEEHF